MREFLNTLLASLNTIEVKGKNNIDVLLGCMMAIEQQIAALDEPTEEAEGE